jgi:hypothetical protein
MKDLLMVRPPKLLMTIFLSALAWITPPFSAIAQEPVYIGAFSIADTERTIPEGWEPLTFDKIKRHTAYEIVNQEGTTVIKAKSKNAASGLIRHIRVDPQKYPIIEWRWQAANIYEKGDVSTKAGDDYPARIYVAFAYDPDTVGFFEKAKFEAYKLIYGEYPPSRAISYIWASHAAVGKMVDNAFTDRVKMIVVESGRKNLNKWVSEQRNLYGDYIRSFDEKPPMISGVAIMTDSDNTGETGTAYYGDILMKPER